MDLWKAVDIDGLLVFRQHERSGISTAYLVAYDGSATKDQCSADALAVAVGRWYPRQCCDKPFAKPLKGLTNGWAYNLSTNEWGYDPTIQFVLKQGRSSN